MLKNPPQKVDCIHSKNSPVRIPDRRIFHGDSTCIAETIWLLPTTSNPLIVDFREFLTEVGVQKAKKILNKDIICTVTNIESDNQDFARMSNSVSLFNLGT